jgi:hypothetical protein
MEPSSDTKPNTCTKFLTALVTCTPLACTSWGSSDMASCSLFWTWTWAMSGLVPALKVRVMVAWPEDSLVEDM